MGTGRLLLGLDLNLRALVGEDGFMISAPAGDREEALAVSNKLMRDFLDRPKPATFRL